MAPRIRAYRTEDIYSHDIVIRGENYRYLIYLHSDEHTVAYMESGRFFAGDFLRYGGLYLHASAVELDGKVYLFSGPCGTGESTHTRIWQQVFREKEKVFNDNKPALYRLENRWNAYGPMVRRGRYQPQYER